MAIIADWLTNLGGAERVVLDMHKAFPEADIYTSAYNPEKLPQFKRAKIYTSFLQKFPFAKTKHQLFLGLMPYAFESFDLSKYDVVLSSSFACAKGVITKPQTTHICYCHTPMRYVWDESHSFIETHSMNPILKKFAKPMLHKMRIWDKLASDRPNIYIANSNHIANKIKKYYEKDSTVIYPAVGINPDNEITNNKEDFYIAAGRIKAYKRFDLIIEAFNKLQKRLYIIGTGEELNNLKSLNKNPNTEFLGFVDEKLLKKLYSRAKALIFPQNEDFGIIPIEAQSFGCPIIAYKKGGSLETVINKKTGIFFDKQDSESLIEAINQFEKLELDYNQIREHAKKFSQDRFQNEIKDFVFSKLK